MIRTSDHQPLALISLVYRRQSVLDCKLCNPVWIAQDQRPRDRNERAHAPVGRFIRVPKGSDSGQIRNHLLQQFRPFPAQFSGEFSEPVTFPPGRAKLSTSPASIGSSVVTMTMGIALVASLAA